MPGLRISALAACAAILAVAQDTGPYKYLAGPFSWQRWATCAAVCFAAFGGPRLCWLAYHTLGRDLQLLLRLSRMVLPLIRIKRKDLSLADVFEESVVRHPDKKLVVFVKDGDEHDYVTFKQVDDLANQTCHLFVKEGYTKGSVLAVFMDNRVDMLSTWLGPTKAGIIAALINTHVRGAALTHTIGVVKARGVVFTSETENALAEVLSDLPADFGLYKLDSAPVDPRLAALADRTKMLQPMLRKMPTTRIEGKHAGSSDVLLYIFTSGTTGMPKAATIKNFRYCMFGWGLFSCGGMKRSDVLYTALPMYHVSANCMCLGAAIVVGLTLVCRKKFSASNYFKDCAKFNVTCAQYIGEVARYLLLSPVSEYDRSHNVRFIFGNGINPSIWDRVRERFGVGITEFYGASEGNCSMVNFSNRRGAIGFISWFIPPLTTFRLVRVDPDTGEVVRGPDGLCVLCGPRQPGEVVSPIKRGDPLRDFDGYADREATKKKVLQDVFRKGDICFRSGDLMEMDEIGWMYFVDRCGDTFRWKGENVSTMEVDAIMTGILGSKDVVVYGVEIPGSEGRAGMAAIGMGEKKSLDFKELYAKIDEKLPFYSRPVFLRLQERLELTATLKLKKRDLQRDGFDLGKINDDVQIYVADKARASYVPLTEKMQDDIVAGKITF